ncbi:hypothetical protein PLESTB_000773400 [Pleodorina starrii]|uniref:Uncharacterized protein n=1 Tax=Pleodorina starrii TaxID=330485 RepID=A0A9W6BK44_9CHLO|nr:hypothetical protein PLESTB_000773400 [Pleodorina starrii]
MQQTTVRQSTTRQAASAPSTSPTADGKSCANAAYCSNASCRCAEAEAAAAAAAALVAGRSQTAQSSPAAARVQPSAAAGSNDPISNRGPSFKEDRGAVALAGVGRRDRRGRGGTRRRLCARDGSGFRSAGGAEKGRWRRRRCLRTYEQRAAAGVGGGGGSAGTAGALQQGLLVRAARQPRGFAADAGGLSGRQTHGSSVPRSLYAGTPSWEAAMSLLDGSRLPVQCVVTQAEIDVGG